MRLATSASIISKEHTCFRKSVVGSKPTLLPKGIQEEETVRWSLLNAGNRKTTLNYKRQASRKGLSFAELQALYEHSPLDMQRLRQPSHSLLVRVEFGGVCVYVYETLILKTSQFKGLQENYHGACLDYIHRSNPQALPHPNPETLNPTQTKDLALLRPGPGCCAVPFPNQG